MLDTLALQNTAGRCRDESVSFACNDMSDVESDSTYKQWAILIVSEIIPEVRIPANNTTDTDIQDSFEIRI